MTFLRQLPPRPNLDHLKKQAKDLLHAAQTGEALPDGLAKDSQLSDAQYQVAKSYGFASWPELKKAVAERQPLARALRDLAAGKMCILFDDVDRENEGDFVIAAQFATGEAINFMANHGRGAICGALSARRAEALGIHATDKAPPTAETANFGPSLDCASHRTGISAQDRAETARSLVQEGATLEQFKSPGHLHTLIAARGGLADRQGHTEGSLELIKKAGLLEGTVICEIMNADGTMARLPDLEQVALQHDMALVTTSDLLTRST